MRIRLYHARILTMMEKEDIFEGEVWIKDDKIEKVFSKNQWEDVAENEFDQQIDCMGNLLMPGFKNGHAHGPMTFLRSFADDLPLDEWLHQMVFPAEALLQEEDIYILMQLAILEYIRGGITTSFEMYFYPEMIAKACIDLGFRVVLSGTIFGEEHNITSAMQTLRNDYDCFSHYHDLVSYRIGFHSEYSCCGDLLQQVALLCKEKKEPAFMHVCETKREVAECIKRHGKPPIAFMDDLGMFAYGGGGHHLLYTTDKEREILKKRNLFVVTNPSSNLKLASGIAPISEYLEAGIPVVLGTDGPASNNSLNFFKEMYLATCLQKVKYDNAGIVKPFEVLKMATVNSANMLGLFDCVSIAENQQADLVLIDLLKPNMQPINSIVNNLVYSGSTDNVIMTMVAGRILYANGSYLVPVDPIEIYQKSNLIIRRIACNLK